MFRYRCKVLPPDVIPKNVQALIAGIPERLHLYLSFSASAAADRGLHDGLESVRWQGRPDD